jgi:hypothetical protein
MTDASEDRDELVGSRLRELAVPPEDPLFFARLERQRRTHRRRLTVAAVALLAAASGTMAAAALHSSDRPVRSAVWAFPSSSWKPVHRPIGNVVHLRWTGGLLGPAYGNQAAATVTLSLSGGSVCSLASLARWVQRHERLEADSQVSGASGTCWATLRIGHTAITGQQKSELVRLLDAASFGGRIAS